jgi:class 3 adenylate cyclase
VDADIAIRLGLDSGPVRFFADTGKIVSEVINYAAHLVKRMSCPGCVSISSRVAQELPQRICGIFEPAGVFEDVECFASYRRMDDLLSRDACDSPSVTDRKGSRRRSNAGGSKQIAGAVADLA